jgi:hypothetical protein
MELNRFYTETAIPAAPKHTGYVPNLLDPETRNTQAFKLFNMHDDNPKLPYGSTFQQQATIRIHVATPLNQAFFSEKNMKYLQDEIRFGVWNASNQEYVIDPQNPDDLKAVMRSYYLQYSTNDPSKSLNDQLEYLNKLVLNFSIDRVMVEIKQYIKYRKDIVNYPEQISRPINANMVGSKSAEFKSFF